MAKIRNDEEFFAVIDGVAESAARVETLKAQQKEAEIALKLEWGKKIEAVEKPRKSEFKRAKAYALDHRARLLPDSKKSGTTKCATWGFKEYPAKVIPIIKQSDAAMAELLYTRADGLGRNYLNISYTLDKSKIADALAKGVKWIKSLFQQTKDEEFFAEKIKEKAEEK